jgi:hypothetical protein
LPNREQVEELAAEARSLLNSPALVEAFDRIEDQALAELRTIPVGDLTAHVPHARIYALNELKATLQSFVTDLEMLRRQGR